MKNRVLRTFYLLSSFFTLSGVTDLTCWSFPNTVLFLKMISCSVLFVTRNGNTWWSTTSECHECFWDLKTWRPRWFNVRFEQHWKSRFSWAHICWASNHHCLILWNYHVSLCYFSHKHSSLGVVVLRSVIKASTFSCFAFGKTWAKGTN